MCPAPASSQLLQNKPSNSIKCICLRGIPLIICMPTCRKCHKPFPVKQEINGKVRNLKNRKYCLVCSPFGLHNTVTLENSPDHCPSGKPKRKRTYRDRAAYLIQHQKKQRLKRKTQAVNYKGGKCYTCGYKKCIGALEFHHVDPSTKEMDLSVRNICKAWKVVRKELDKCVCVCANCHREVNAGLRFIPKDAHKICNLDFAVL